MKDKFKFILVMAFSIIMVAVPSAYGKDYSKEGASTFLQALSEQALLQLAKPDATNDDVETSFRKMYRASFDTKALPYLVLGAYWRKLTDSQKVEFSDSFENLLASSYALKFRDLNIPSFAIQGSQQVKENVFAIDSPIEDMEGELVQVGWRIRGTNGYKIYDITIGGVSLVVTHRRDFSEYIRQHGGSVGSLLTKLSHKEEQHQQ